MKKIFSLLLCVLLISFCSINNLELSADSYIIKDNVKSEETLDGGVEYKYEELTVYDYGKTKSYDFDAISLSLNNASSGTVKLATWTYNSRYDTNNVTLDKIAANYETNHPGWKVVGGINSEGWWSSGGVTQISNTYVCDGEIFRGGVSSENYKELIGIYPDNTTYIKRFPTYTDNMILTLYDDKGEIIDKIDVNNLNQLPENNELSLITIQSDTLDVTGFNVIEGSYINYRRPMFYTEGTYQILESDNDAVYLKGNIIGKCDKTTISGLDYKFYLVSKDETTINKIATATQVRCQYEFVDEFKNTPNITGYMFKVIEDGKVLEPSYRQDNTQYYLDGYTKFDDSFTYGDHSYVTTNNKRRACIGFTDDGGIVLMTCVTQAGQGPTQFQLGQAMADKGCTSAYQFDGGGSVTLVKRDEFDNFKIMTNTSSSITTGIFFVVPDPDIKVVSTNRFSMTFNIGNSSVKNVVVHINDNAYPIDANNLTINGLNEGTEYEYYFTYDIPSYLDETKYVSTQSMVYHKETESFVYPNPQFTISDITKTSITINKGNVTDQIFNVKVIVGDLEYQMENKEVFIIDDLIYDTEYTISYEYDCIDQETSLTYHGTISGENIKTRLFNIPNILDFKVSSELDGGKVSFKYKYEDDDDVIVEAYLYCNSSVEELSRKSGTISFENIEDSYSAYLELVYVDGENRESIKSEKINYTSSQKEKEEETPESNTDKTEKKKCGKKSSLFVLSLISILSVVILVFRKKH